MPRWPDVVGLDLCGLDWHATPPAQHWFRSIWPGDTPANSDSARLAHAVISEWIAEQGA